MTPIRIIIAARSPISRTLIARLLGRLSGVEISGEADSIAQTLALLDAARPDIAVLAGRLARSHEFEVLRPAILSASCRWIEVAPDYPAPSAMSGPGRPRLSHGLSDVEVTAALEAILSAPLDCPNPLAEPPQTPSFAPADERVILMGASTGGVDALLDILSAFPADCPPTAIVQHTTRNNSGGLVQLLGQKCAPEIVAPYHGMELRRGMICVAGGGDQHLRLHASDALRCLLNAGPPICGQLPSVDALFHSATAWAHRVVAVILTGMGRDGAEGLAALRQGGATTIGQDAATSLVYGMPRAAWELGAVAQRLPLPKIAEATLAASRREIVR